jgi:MFS family permease
MADNQRGHDARDDVDGGYGLTSREATPAARPAAQGATGAPVTAAAVSPGPTPVAVADHEPVNEKWAVVRAFRHRDYRLFFLGAFLSNIGSWLANVAEGYFIYTLTHSNALLGIMAFFSTIPVLLFGPLAGVVADRFHRKKILITTQLVFLFTTGSLAILIYRHQAGIHPIEVWYLLTLAGIGGIAQAFNSPAYQSLTVEFVGPEDLMNAIALNSMQFNLSRIVGAMTGGYIYAFLGPVWCFGLNSFSFIAVIIALLMVTIKPPSLKGRSDGIWKNFLSGMRFLRRHHALMAIVMMAATVTVLAIPYFTLLPSFAVDVLHGDSRMQAQLLAAVGVGALMAAFLQASARDSSGMGRQMLVSMASLSVCLAVFAQSNEVWLSYIALLGTGAAMVGFMTTANTAMQLLVPDHMRGRLMGVFVMSAFGLSPIGSLLMGLVAQKTGPQVALFLGALTCGILTIIVALRFPRIREI